MIEEGQTAPSFTLPDQDGREISLEDLRGQPVVLYFYPKDDTPGCTTQACDVRDRWTEFEQVGAAVLGVSPDPVDSHARFAEKHDLPHRLLADPDHDVMEAYEAWGEKNMYGKKVLGVIRSTVLIGPDGTIVKRWKRVQAKKHADQVLTALEELTG